MNKQQMIKKIAEYFKTQPVLKAWLFGSYSRGEERPDSDVAEVQFAYPWRDVYGFEGYSESRG